MTRQDRPSPPVGYWPLPAAARLVRLAPGRVRRYVHAGLVRPARIEGGESLFGREELARLRKIRRLIDELGLNAAGVEVVLRLLDEMERMRAADGRRTDDQAVFVGVAR